MRTIGKSWRKYITFLVMAFFAYAVQPDTMVGAAPHANITAAPQADLTMVQNTTAFAVPTTAQLHQPRCCHGMMVCPGILACHGISMQVAYLPVHYPPIQNFVPAAAPEKLSGRRLAPQDPPPIYA